jgi:hypothetical protein
MYDSAAGACSAFSAIVDLRGPLSVINNQPEWRVGMPWLYYPDTNSDPCFDQNITSVMNLNSRMMNYKVAKYAVNGTYMGLEDASTLFAYCSLPAPMTAKGGGPTSETDWTLFGNSKVFEWKCDLSSLLKSEMFFYDLFYYEEETNSLHAVPVRLVNYDEYDIKNLKYVDNHCGLTDVLVRRFFLYDTLSGIPSDGSTLHPR